MGRLDFFGFFRRRKRRAGSDAASSPIDPAAATAGATVAPVADPTRGRNHGGGSGEHAQPHDPGDPADPGHPDDPGHVADPGGAADPGPATDPGPASDPGQIKVTVIRESRAVDYAK
jgi:hypothetical protein